MSSKVMIN